MIKSMTGFGKAIAETPQKKITIEIKSLNSRQLDLNTKLPWLYREKEPEIRNLVSQKLDRGKIEMAIYFDILGDEGVPVINKVIVKNYYKQLREISSELDIEAEEQYLPAILRLPEAMKTERPELTENEWKLVKDKITESINTVDFYRIEEGKSIERDIRSCLAKISESLEKIEDFEPERITRVRERLVSILTENAGTENIDKNRFEQELIFYLEKFDINEEKVRLRKHCEYFIQTLDIDAPNGRKLNFIAQEIGREINTIGSKANDASIQKLVVMMKDELEKIKEQTGNIL
ncbi:MAG: YicC family protein [Bacteroidales bacterium]|nr:YicC family protein [Bacteroidales bacterium]